MMHKIVAVSALLAVAACNPPPSPLAAPEGVRIATADQVAACSLVTGLTTTPGVTTSVARQETLTFMRNSALDQAAKAGANTVVFTTGGPGDEDALIVEGQAYLC